MVTSLGVTSLGCLSSHAASIPKTNDVVISYAAPSLDWESSIRSEVLVDRFLQEAVASDTTVFDRFNGPAARLSWTRRRDALGYGSIDRFNSEGTKMFTTIAADSLRTAAAAALPLDAWEDHWHGWLGRLINGTIGNPEEEHVDMTSVSYSAVRSSWETSNERGGLLWGVRPWRTSPYVYFLAHAGRMAGLPLFTFEGRGGYSMFGSAKLEARVTLQLPGSFRLAGGASLDISLMASHGQGASHFAVNLERVLRLSDFTPESVFFVGLRSGHNGSSSNPRMDNQILAGIFKRW